MQPRRSARNRSTRSPSGSPSRRFYSQRTAATTAYAPPTVTPPAAAPQPAARQSAARQPTAPQPATPRAVVPTPEGPATIAPPVDASDTTATQPTGWWYDTTSLQQPRAVPSYQALDATRRRRASGYLNALEAFAIPYRRATMGALLDGPGSRATEPLGVHNTNQLVGLRPATWVRYPGVDMPFPFYPPPTLVRGRADDGSETVRLRGPIDAEPDYNWEDYREYLSLWRLPETFGGALRNNADYNIYIITQYPEPSFVDVVYSLDQLYWNRLEPWMANVDPSTHRIRVHSFPYRLIVEPITPNSSAYRSHGGIRWSNSPFRSFRRRDQAGVIPPSLAVRNPDAAEPFREVGIGEIVTFRRGPAYQYVARINGFFSADEVHAYGQRGGHRPDELLNLGLETVNTPSFMAPIERNDIPEVNVIHMNAVYMRRVDVDPEILSNPTVAQHQAAVQFFGDGNFHFRRPAGLLRWEAARMDATLAARAIVPARTRAESAFRYMNHDNNSRNMLMDMHGIDIIWIPNGHGLSSSHAVPDRVRLLTAATALHRIEIGTPTVRQLRQAQATQSRQCYAPTVRQPQQTPGVHLPQEIAPTVRQPHQTQEMNVVLQPATTVKQRRLTHGLNLPEPRMPILPGRTRAGISGQQLHAVAATAGGSQSGRPSNTPLRRSGRVTKSSARQRATSIARRSPRRSLIVRLRADKAGLRAFNTTGRSAAGASIGSRRQWRLNITDAEWNDMGTHEGTTVPNFAQMDRNNHAHWQSVNKWKAQKQRRSAVKNNGTVQRTPLYNEREQGFLRQWHDHFDTAFDPRDLHREFRKAVTGSQRSEHGLVEWLKRYAKLAKGLPSRAGAQRRPKKEDVEAYNKLLRTWRYNVASTQAADSDDNASSTSSNEGEVSDYRANPRDHHPGPGRRQGGPGGGTGAAGGLIVA